MPAGSPEVHLATANTPPGAPAHNGKLLASADADATVRLCQVSQFAYPDATLCIASDRQRGKTGTGTPLASLNRRPAPDLLIRVYGIYSTIRRDVVSDLNHAP
jgi:hypothetical protein